MTAFKLSQLLKLLPVSLALVPALALADESSNPVTTTTTTTATATASAIDIASIDLSFPSDILRIHTNGYREPYEVSTSEFYVKDKLTGDWNIETLAEPFGSAEQMRQFVRDEDSVWGQDCKLVLYRQGMPQNDENRRFLTSKIEIQLDPDVASMEMLHDLAASIGVEVLSTKISKRGFAALQASCGGSAVKAAEILSKRPNVLRARPMLTIPLMKCSLPNDPFFRIPEQYYMHPDSPLQIQAAAVWCGGVLFELQQPYFGRNVDISLLDDGIQGDHPEIERAYSFGKDTDFVDEDNDGAPQNFLDNHGTEMAGIIVGRHNNGLGIAGIAPAAEIFSTRVFDVASDPQKMADAHEHERASTEIVVTGFVPGGNYVDISELLEDAFDSLADKKDIAIVYPAGGSQNGARMDYDRATSHRHTIATAALGTQSEPGSSIIATAWGIDMTTTDRTGVDGDSMTDDFIFDFGGTSAAAACTAGVVALMHDARPDLGWRDYQEILMLTGQIFDPTFFPNGVAVQTPLSPFPIPLLYSYNWGAGFLDAEFAVALAEVWSRLPDTAATYRPSSVSKSINEDIGSEVQNFLFDFNRIVPSKKNMRIEHIEIFLEWEEPPSGQPAELLPAFVRLVDPYYFDGTVGAPTEDRPDILRPPLIGGLSSIVSSRAGNIGAPVEWTYTTVRHWGQVNTGGFDRIGVPGQRDDKVIPAGVWELEVSVEPRIDPLNPQLDKLTRRLVSAEITMYGTDNNIPPTVVSANLTSSGNPGVFSPRTAFVDEDLQVSDVVYFDPEGNPITTSYVWQRLGEDGLTWKNVTNANPVFVGAQCTFDETTLVEVKADVNGSLDGRYFILYDATGASVAFWIQSNQTTPIPAGAAAADRAVAIAGIVRNEGAVGVATDVSNAILAEGSFGVILPNPFTNTLTPEQFIVTYPPGTGSMPNALVATSSFSMTQGISQDPLGNCFSTSSSTLPASKTSTEQKYRVIITPRDGLREGFRFISDAIIVNSRPVLTASYDKEYRYNADLWIETVPPDNIDSFAFINEVSQGSGDRTTNTEWIEIMVNYSIDMRGFRLTNDIASFDLTFTESPVWEVVPFGTMLVIYNGDQRDVILPPDTTNFQGKNVWIISSSNPALFTLPSNGDGWGEFSNKDCTNDDSCDGAHVALLPKFLARNPIHGVSFNGNDQYVDAGIAAAEQALYFDGTAILGDPNGMPPTVGVNDSGGWAPERASRATPGAANSPNNQAILDQIFAEGKTSIPSYRFYPGDGTQQLIEPLTGRQLGTADLVPSDMVPGLKINSETGVVSGKPEVLFSGVYTIKIQRSHSFSSEIQIYELNIKGSLLDEGDDDGDNLINLFENAFGTDPLAAQANVLPTGQIITSLGMQYPSISFRRLKGGVLDAASQDYTTDTLVYTVEGSTDLTDWKRAPDIVVLQESVVDSADSPSTVEIATFRVFDPIDSVELGDHYYLRLSVTRITPP